MVTQFPNQTSIYTPTAVYVTHLYGTSPRQEYLLEFTSEYGISEALHLELPGPGERIVDFLEGKVGVYTKLFEFAYFCLPLSQFLFDILGHYQIHLSQLSVIGWMSFSKRPRKNTPQSYTKPLDSLKNWNNRFFSVDERVFPTIVDWRISASKDEMPAENTYSSEAVMLLNTHRTPIQKQPEALLCLLGLSRRYFLENEVYPTFLHDDDQDMDLFDLIRAPNPTKVKNGTRPRAAHEVPLLIVTASRVIEMEDPAAATDSSGIPSTIERSPLDFANENPSQQSTGGHGPEDQGQEAVAPEVPPLENVTTMGVGPEASQAEGIAATGPHVIKERRKRSNDGVDTNAPLKVLRRDHADSRPTQSTHGGKSLAAMGVGMGSTRPVPASRGASVDVSDPDPLSFANPQSLPTTDVAQERPLSEIQNRRIPLLPPWSGHPKAFIDQSGEAKLLKKSVAQVAHRDKRIQARETEIMNLETLLEAETDMKKTTKGKSAELSKELENLRALFSDLQVSNNRLSQQVSTLQAQVFADVVSAGIANGMSDGLRYGVEHGKTNLSLEAIEAYDPEAEAKYIAALHALKDLKYPIVDQLKSLKDAPMDVIMASLHPESDTGDDAPQWIRKLRPSSSQLKIPVSDGVPVSVPTVAPQGLYILLADAATQTDISEDWASPRLLKSSSLLVMHN
uniref:Transposase (Putative), gypsy type n=1 Tax=Tanacetum cinerariifolium TaxID=118510 RepID=A0A6L2MCQ0_TANCI|nr:hypothetical protein [Tanacetum cinerariifolium]